MTDLFSQSEYLHVLFNPIVTHGLPLATLLLVVALFFRSRALLVAALILVAVTAAWVWPTMHSGLAGFDRVQASIDSTGGEWLQIHMWRAMRWEPAFYATALLAAVAAGLVVKWPKVGKCVAVAVAVLALLASWAGAYVAFPAEKVRHEEFRDRKPPAQQLLRAETDGALHEHSPR